MIMTPVSKPLVHLNHIGVAVNKLPEMEKLFSILGLSISHSEPVPEQGVNTHFLPLPSKPTAIEFLEVLDPQGTVSKFIEKKGPGIHHLSFETEQGMLDSLCADLKQSGYRMIYDTPKKGAHSMRINFIHPASAGGILIELMEPEKS